MSLKEARLYTMFLFTILLIYVYFAMDGREKWKRLPRVFGGQGTLETGGGKFCSQRDCSQPPARTSFALQLLPGRNQNLLQSTIIVLGSNTTSKERRKSPSTTGQDSKMLPCEEDWGSMSQKKRPPHQTVMSKRSSEAGQEEHFCPKRLSFILFFLSQFKVRDNAAHLCNSIPNLGSGPRPLPSLAYLSRFSGSSHIRGNSGMSHEMCLTGY